MSFNFVIPEFNINGAGTSPLQFFKRGFNLGASGSSPSWQDIVLSGNGSLTLTNALANGLNYLKLFGGTEQLPETYLDTVTLSGGCEQRNLPSGYTQVEYIESTGTQAINTGVKYTGNNFVIEWEAKDNSTAQGTTLFACTGAQPYSGGLFGISSSRKYYIGTCSAIELNYSSNDDNYHKWKLVVSGQTVTLYKDGVQTGTGSLTGTINTTNNIYLFCGGWADNSNQTLAQFAKWELKSWKFTDNGVVKFNAIPAKDSNNVAGIYDTVTGNFLTNQGTGTFTAGAEAVPSPDTPMDIVCNNGAIKAVSPSGLPEGHTELEYIELTGSQYVDTGIKNIQNKEFGIVAQQTELLSGFQTILGALDSSDSNYKVVFGYGSSSKFYTQCGVDGPSYTIGSTQDTNKHTFKVVNTTNSAQLTIDNNVYTGSYAITSTETYSLFIGARNRANVGNYSKQKVWNFYEKVSGEYTHYYVPDKYNNTLGFYDTVTDTFIPVVGSGAVGGNPVWTLGVKGTVETVTDSNGLTAIAQMLLSVGDYKDTQEVLSGAVTRNIGIKVLDGTESWTLANSPYEGTNRNLFYTPVSDALGDTMGICSIALFTTAQTSIVPAPVCRLTTTKNLNIIPFSDTTTISTVNAWKQYLATQYANGTPVIIAYPLATATTETATPQLLQKSPVTQTAGSISNLPIVVTSSSHTTPTPQQPLQINCNNGVLKYGQYGKNLFDVNNVEIQASTAISADGSLVTNGSVNTCLTFISVKPNTTYTISEDILGTDTAFFRLAQYKADKTFISRSEDSTEQRSSYTFTTSANTYYIRFHYRNSANLNTYQLEQGSTATPYEPYHFGLHTDGTVETVEVTGKNLFDKNNRERIYGYFPNTGYSWTYNGSAYSNRIPCLPNTTYTARYNGNSSQVVLSFASTSSDRVPTADSQSVSVTNSIRQNSPTIDTPITITTGASDKWLIVAYNLADPQNTDMADNLQIELGSTATTYEPYFNGGSATAEMLLKVGDYKDEQSVLDGDVTRNVGIKVLDGTEEYTYTEPNTYGIANITSTITGKADGNTNLFMCSHFVPQTTSWSLTQTEGILNGNNNNQVFFRVLGTRIPSLSAWTQFLADQYQAGNPVIIVYPLATATTESVTAQPLTIQAGTNIVEITQASIDNLELEVSYKGKEGG